MIIATILVLTATTALAQVNTTGSLSGARVSQTTTTTTPTTGGTTTTPPVTTTTPTTPTTTGTPTTTQDPAAGVVPTARDAAIVLCGQDFSTGGGALLVFSASVSANVPAAAPGASCAQAIADLFAAGFGVIDVQPFNQQIQYTLVR